jgi:vitamin B12 transporter
MRKVFSLFTAIGLLTAAPAFAQANAQKSDDETIIVTATRAREGLSRAALGSSVSLLDAQELQERQTRQVADILRDVPGVSVNRTGGFGGQTQLRMRGSESNHTLVLIDGMEANHPFYGEFDFATLIADDVARIEVLRGQQSALYGSDAIGGVVHYITLSGAEAPGVRGRAEYGSFNSWDAAARVADVAGPGRFRHQRRLSPDRWRTGRPQRRTRYRRHERRTLRALCIQPVGQCAHPRDRPLRLHRGRNQ